MFCTHWKSIVARWHLKPAALPWQRATPQNDDDDNNNNKNVNVHVRGVRRVRVTGNVAPGTEDVEPGGGVDVSSRYVVRTQLRLWGFLFFFTPVKHKHKPFFPPT